MVNPFIIKYVDALQVLDSRGDPTVEVVVETAGGGVGRAIAPSGASKSKFEAVELRDGDAKRYKGRGVEKAVSNVVNYIAPAIQGMDSRRQRTIDDVIIRLDGTPNKSRLGGNAIIATSFAVAKAAADTAKMPLFQFIGGLGSRMLPMPMLNIINGGAHAGNELSVQEFMIVPVGFDSFSEALRASTEIYKELKSVLKERYGAGATNVGDEGGYAPPMKLVREALDAIAAAIKRCGYDLTRDVRLSIDAAASQFYIAEEGLYNIDGMKLDKYKLADYWKGLAEEFNLLSIEDPFSEEDLEGFKILKELLKGRTIIIGDDVTATNVVKLREVLSLNGLGGVIVKPNQAGTVSETLDFVALAKANGIPIVISHRSGDSEDNAIAHLAVAVGAPFIKTGAPCRGERTAKYNELLRIEKYLGLEAVYAGKVYKF